jgi:transposase
MKHERPSPEVERELQRIRELREALDLQRTLSHAEARAAWEELEQRYSAAQQEIERLGYRGPGAAAKLVHTSATALRELRRGYERLHSTSGRADPRD